MGKISATLKLGIILTSIVTISACSKNSDNAILPNAPINESKIDSNQLSRLPRIPIKGALREANELKAIPDNWFTKGPSQGVEGANVEVVYEQIGLPKGEKVIVAVVDSGVDINHEDLKNKIWTNPGEIGRDKNGQNKANNFIDDDGNGYIDDVHGWNFIGGQDLKGNPTHINTETLEVTRELVKMKAKEAEYKSKGLKLPPKEQEYLEKVTKVVADGRKEANETIDILKPALVTLVENYEILKEVLKVELDDVTDELLKNLTNLNPTQADARDKMLKVLTDTKYTSVVRLKNILASSLDALVFYYNEDYNPRREIIGDDPENMSDKYYGNNDVIGPDADHGTHVAGIIAADRNNGIGIQGIATNVEIMAVRAIPNGDERDKDVANSIRYAVDNGAQIINMSFGKGFSPHKIEVSEAMQYAADKGVLLVHAAGNDAEDNDVTDNFPNRNALDKEGNIVAEVSTWVEVGASTPTRDENLVATFSNYGKSTVDIFAPGYKLKSTTPKNTYATFSGTSMATPTIAGSLALVMSQRHDLSPWMVRQAVVEKRRTYEGLNINLPGSDPVKLVPFSDLSIWGGVVDAFNAINVIIGDKGLVGR